MPTLHLRTKAGPKPITPERLIDLLEDGRIGEDAEVVSCDGGLTWLTGDEALDRYRAPVSQADRIFGGSPGGGGQSILEGGVKGIVQRAQAEVHPRHSGLGGAWLGRLMLLGLLAALAWGGYALWQGWSARRADDGLLAGVAKLADQQHPQFKALLAEYDKRVNYPRILEAMSQGDQQILAAARVMMHHSPNFHLHVLEHVDPAWALAFRVEVARIGFLPKHPVGPAQLALCHSLVDEVLAAKDAALTEGFLGTLDLAMAFSPPWRYEAARRVLAWHLQSRQCATAVHRLVLGCYGTLPPLVSATMATPAIRSVYEQHYRAVELLDGSRLAAREPGVEATLAIPAKAAVALARLREVFAFNRLVVQVQLGLELAPGITYRDFLARLKVPAGPGWTLPAGGGLLLDALKTGHAGELSAASTACLDTLDAQRLTQGVGAERLLQILTQDDSAAMGAVLDLDHVARHLRLAHILKVYSAITCPDRRVVFAWPTEAQPGLFGLVSHSAEQLAGLKRELAACDDRDRLLDLAVARVMDLRSQLDRIDPPLEALIQAVIQQADARQICFLVDRLCLREFLLCHRHPKQATLVERPVKQTIYRNGEPR